jgi:hypothetical protein
VNGSNRGEYSTDYFYASHAIMLDYRELKKKNLKLLEPWGANPAT